MPKTLVTYFSAQGTTQKVAQKLAAVAGADLFEIVPAQPYTAADLNWNNSQSRSTLESKDRTSRPPVASHVDNMDDYSTVYVGFPIWWYREPTIVDSFLEDYNLDGKVVVPFATSGGSGLGKSAQDMAGSAPGATVLDGELLNGVGRSALEAFVARVSAEA